MIIRDAKVNDAHGIAYAHVSSWNTSYRGIMPDGIFDKLTVENREKFWAKIIEANEADNVLLVAEDETKILGFASGGKPQENIEGYDYELYAIYLLQSAQSTGIGRKLLEAFAKAAHKKGYRTLVLWVLVDNPSSRGFYEHLGGIVVKEGAFQWSDIALKTLAYGWPDIRTLIRDEG